MTEASGTFDVAMIPAGEGGGGIGRVTLAKTYRGDLDAKGAGEMLAYRSPVEGSAGYVAIERVTGTLGGREGGFTLQHSGSLDRGAPTLAVTVVADSGTDGLTGLRGEMEIVATGGEHRYTLRYTLPNL